MIKERKVLAERFWQKVEKSADCWIWTATLNTKGYGVLKIQGRMLRAHRVSFEFVNGPISGKLLVCHKCDNTKCVNPAHLFLGTHQDNTLDMVAKGRHGKPMSLIVHCPQGHTYTPENTYVDPKGARQCRACRRAYDVVRNSRRKL